MNDELAYEKAIMIFVSIGHLPVFINNMNMDIKVLRTRTHETPEYFKNVSDLATTPRKFIKEYARCNRPFQSIFYCSENRPTSFMELLEYWSETKNFEDKLYITIGRWEIIKPLNLILVTSPDKSKRESDFDKYHGDAYDKYLKSKSTEEQEFTGIFFNYLFEKFRKPAKHDMKTYIITTAYSNLALFQAKELADGITYPSVPYGHKGVNFALKADFAKSNLILTHAMWTEFKVTQTSERKRDFKESKSTLTEKIDMAQNIIKW